MGTNCGGQAGVPALAGGSRLKLELQCHEGSLLGRRNSCFLRYFILHPFSLGGGTPSHPLAGQFDELRGQSDHSVGDGQPGGRWFCSWQRSPCGVMRENWLPYVYYAEQSEKFEVDASVHCFSLPCSRRQRTSGLKSKIALWRGATAAGYEAGASVPCTAETGYSDKRPYEKISRPVKKTTGCRHPQAGTRSKLGETRGAGGVSQHRASPGYNWHRG